MSSKTEPEIKGNTHQFDMTKVTFYPDLKRFGMEKLDDDIVALLKKRAYDMAGLTH